MLADRAGAVVALAMGAEGELPDVPDALAAFEAALVATGPADEGLASEDLELLQAIGLR